MRYFFLVGSDFNPLLVKHNLNDLCSVLEEHIIWTINCQDQRGLGLRYESA